MSFKPRQRAAQTLRPIYFTIIVRHQTLDLAVIEHDAVGFIANEASQCVLVIRGDQITGM